MPTRSVTAAIIFIRPSHAGHFSASTPHTRHSSRAQSMRTHFVDTSRVPPSPTRQGGVPRASANACGQACDGSWVFR